MGNILDYTRAVKALHCVGQDLAHLRSEIITGPDPEKWPAIAAGIASKMESGENGFANYRTLVGSTVICKWLLEIGHLESHRATIESISEQVEKLNKQECPPEKFRECVIKGRRICDERPVFSRLVASELVGCVSVIKYEAERICLLHEANG